MLTLHLVIVSVLKDARQSFYWGGGPSNSSTRSSFSHMGHCSWLVNSCCFENNLFLILGIIIGNSAWMLKNGLSFGESQTGFTSQISGIAIINHPIDVQYESSSAEGWPLFVCEVQVSVAV